MDRRYVLGSLRPLFIPPVRREREGEENGKKCRQKPFSVMAAVGYKAQHTGNAYWAEPQASREVNIGGEKGGEHGGTRNTATF